ncbi:MAG: sulfurtransferase TusA family protein [Xenococcaceae cyanobacterium MO_188.B32]|nr:sulfurtransferase TusA family protein [Xenococcaceae cyanobacterium MO_188.B32]
MTHSTRSDETKINSSLKPDAHLDLRGTPCPLNFVRTKLKLEQMSPDSLLEVWLDPGEAIEQVPESLVLSGYVIEKIEDNQEFFALLVRRPSTL